MRAKRLQLKAFVVMFCAAIAAGSCWAQSRDPSIRLEAWIPADEQENLRDLIARFAEAEGFLLQVATPQMPPHEGRRVLWLQLTRNDGMEVMVTDIRQPSPVTWVRRASR